VKGIKRTEFCRGQELGEMQAQNSPEGKESEKDRQYPTPPTCSKASRFGITKKIIDFLLDHDVF